MLLTQSKQTMSSSSVHNPKTRLKHPNNSRSSYGILIELGYKSSVGMDAKGLSLYLFDVRPIKLNRKSTSRGTRLLNFVIVLWDVCAYRDVAELMNGFMELDLLHPMNT